jgi:hypothetical protein
MSIKINKCKENCSICNDSLDRETYKIEDKVTICNDCTRSLIKYYNSNALNSTVYKYTLKLQMNTDDDCIVHYKGKQYCFYGEDFDERLEGDTIDEVRLKLAWVTVCEDGKVSDFTREWLDGLSSAIANDETEDYSEVHCNQTYEFDFCQNF